jgi:hypothetical protein
MKWSPARRVLLLIAVILLIFQPDIRIGGNEVGLGLGWVGAAILFDLLALELGDRVTMKRDLEIARDSTMAGPRSSAACYWKGYRLRHPPAEYRCRGSLRRLPASGARGPVPAMARSS